MLKKIQIKLLSDFGELLNVTTCRSGRISVLRSTNVSDLRPYQRALSGTTETGNLQVICDGVPYNHENHIPLGFGEISPCAGLSVKGFLEKCEIPKDSHLSLLMSVGLAECEPKECSELSMDEERRLRLAVGTAHSSKALILNNPFESIAASWRPQIAELLVSHAKDNGALIIVTSLTYRPEAWIDNDIVDRIQVGQTTQKTIGFGSSDLATTSMMREITSRVRADQVAQPSNGPESPQRQASLATAALGTVAPIDGANNDSANIVPSSVTKSGGVPFLVKAFSVMLGVGLGTWGAFTLTSPDSEGFNPSMDAGRVTNTETKIAKTDLAAPSNRNSSTEKALAADTKQDSQAPPTGKSPIKITNSQHKRYVLDLYPLAIKNSVLKTANGVIPKIEKNQPPEAVANEAKDNRKTGSLFSLLEKASSDEKSNSRQEPGYYGAPAHAEQSYSEEREGNSQELDAMEARREEIRNRFLEAIRQSALRRQAQLEEELDY